MTQLKFISAVLFSLFSSVALAESSTRSNIPLDVSLCPAAISFSNLNFEAKAVQRHLNNDHYIVALQALNDTELNNFSINLVSTSQGQCQYQSTNSAEATAVISKRKSTTYGEDGTPGIEHWDRLMLKINIEDSEFLAFFTLSPYNNRLEIADREHRQSLSTPLTGELARVGFMRYLATYR